MQLGQSAILLDIPGRSRYLTFVIKNVGAVKNTLTTLSQMADGTNIVMGVGSNLVQSLQKEVPGLRAFPNFENAPITIPNSAGDLWFWLRGDDRGELLHRSRALEVIAAPAFALSSLVDGFKYGSGLDLTGYEDGTENPKDNEAVHAAFLSAEETGLNGSSFVAVQQWQHDLNYFEALSETDQNNVIGRNKETNKELENAPDSAHVQRVEQEDFEPEAFVVRRSMPWIEGQYSGLMFVSFAKSFDPFEMQMKRMLGLDDGITDGLFTFSKPLTGGYYWCPPVNETGIDFSLIL